MHTIQNVLNYIKKISGCSNGDYWLRFVTSNFPTSHVTYTDIYNCSNSLLSSVLLFFSNQ